MVAMAHYGFCDLQMVANDCRACLTFSSESGRGRTGVAAAAAAETGREYDVTGMSWNRSHAPNAPDAQLMSAP
jgi:hypothetical protein